MPTWGEILREVQESAETRAPEGQGPDLDGIRRPYVARLHEVTGRPVILYSSDWLRNQVPATSIVLGDMTGMMEVCKDVPGPAIDIILHSPGGSAEAVAAIVRYLRGKYTEMRVFVPVAAMSAATMWALASDQIVMGKHSQLGPIDPQMVTPRGQFPARALIEEFERAKLEIAENPGTLGAWLPILQQYPPSLLEQCENAERLARRLVGEWLASYMFRLRDDREAVADAVADYFANYEVHQSHSLGITRDQCVKQGLTIGELEENQDLQDAVLSLHHATIHSFAGPAVKLIENHLGRAFVEVQQAVQVQVPAFPVPLGPGQPGPAGPVPG